VVDTGYFSKANVNICCEQQITPLIALSREEHHPDPLARFTEPAQPKEDATEVAKMRHLLLTMAVGRSMRNANARWSRCLHHQAILGFRQFSLRGWKTSKAS